MQIRRIQIADFGKLHDMELNLSEGFQTITGENGWGKSTMAAFIKAMLYGMEATTRRSLLENERRHYQPWQRCSPLRGGPRGSKPAKSSS